MFLDGLVSFLQANTGVAAQIGNRLMPAPNTAQPPVYPFTAFTFMPAAAESRTMESKILRKARIQFDHTGRLSTCEVVANAFLQALDTYVGVLPDGSYVAACEEDGGVTGPTGVIDPTLGTISKWSQDFVFQYRDAADG